MPMNMSTQDSKELSLPFVKMQSVGNEIIILPPEPRCYREDVRALCHRKTGIGCDQVMVLSDPMVIWNQDGSLAEACGNGTRCVISYLNSPLGEIVTLQSPAGTVTGWRNSDGTVSVCQGNARIGVVRTSKGDEVVPSISLDAYDHRLHGVPVDMGNPHLVVVAQNMPPLWEQWSPSLSHLFPEGANISFVTQVGDDLYNVCVWERGVGPTQGCASAACAIAAVLDRNEPLLLNMPGGEISVKSSPEGWIHTAPVSSICEGRWYRPCSLAMGA